MSLCRFLDVDPQLPRFFRPNTPLRTVSLDVWVLRFRAVVWQGYAVLRTHIAWCAGEIGDAWQFASLPGEFV